MLCAGVKPSCIMALHVLLREGLALVHACCRYMPSPEVPAQEPGTPLRTNNLFKHVQVRHPRRAPSLQTFLCLSVNYSLSQHPG